MKEINNKTINYKHAPFVSFLFPCDASEPERATNKQTNKQTNKRTCVQIKNDKPSNVANANNFNNMQKQKLINNFIANIIAPTLRFLAVLGRRHTRTSSSGHNFLLIFFLERYTRWVWEKRLALNRSGGWHLSQPIKTRSPQNVIMSAFMSSRLQVTDTHFHPRTLNVRCIGKCVSSSKATSKAS